MVARERFRETRRVKHSAGRVSLRYTTASYSFIYDKHLFSALGIHPGRTWACAPMQNRIDGPSTVPDACLTAGTRGGNAVVAGERSQYTGNVSISRGGATVLNPLETLV